MGQSVQRRTKLLRKEKGGAVIQSKEEKTEERWKWPTVQGAVVGRPGIAHLPVPKHREESKRAREIAIRCLETYLARKGSEALK